MTTPEERSRSTPGPWTVTANSWQYTTIYDADGRVICQLDLENWDVTEENQEELEAEQAKVAALIAQAPALLAQVEELTELLRRVDHTLSVHGHFDTDTPLHDSISAALASHATPERSGGV